MLIKTSQAYKLAIIQYSMQNAAERLITQSCKYYHITPVLINLHWLPVEYRVKFKLLLLTFKALNELAPKYLTEMIEYYTPSRTLRSSSAFLLKQVRFNLQSYGAKSFTISAPMLWNNLPLDLRSCSNLDIFKSKLKTYLFKLAFKLDLN